MSRVEYRVLRSDNTTACLAQDAGHWSRPVIRSKGPALPKTLLLGDIKRTGLDYHTYLNSDFT